MGCTQSKIENEETVIRCKERKLHMKEAVSARNAFAAAHSSYIMSLKNAGASLSDFGQSEVPSSSSMTSSSSTAAGGSLASAALPQPPVDPFPPPPPVDPFPPPPPPPPLVFPTSPLQRAVTMPEISLIKPVMTHHPDAILEDEENDDEFESESSNHAGLKHRSTKSSGGGGGIGGRNGISRQEEDELPKPPSPPRTPPLQSNNRELPPPPPPPPENKGMPTWDYFFPSMENVPGPTLDEVDEGRMEREEFQRKVFEETAKRSEIDSQGGGRDGGSGGGDGASTSGGGGGGDKEEVAEVAEKPPELPPQAPPPQARAKRVKQVVPAETKRRGSSNVSLMQIFNGLDDCFLEASESAHEVTKMLEAARLHYHSNFADNRGHIDHSAKVMRVITWNKSFRGLPNADDGKDDLDSEVHETHATVLDKMLAWEKKLYDGVKAGEQMKLEYQRKVAQLNKLKSRGSTEALERMKATVSHLHTRYIVDMQSMDSTVSEINRLRDQQLYPKLVALVDAMTIMWESMSVRHENQSKIVQALRALDISQSPKETTEHHHERTVQLWHVVSEWHSQFDKLIIHQKEYIKALSSWLKLNLIPIDTSLKDKVSSPQRPQIPPIHRLLQAWHDNLDKLPDELARTAINNFAAVINTIMQYQIDEIKLRDKCEGTRRELGKKTRQFEDWCNKYMQRRTPDEMDSDQSQVKNHIAERKLQVEAIEHRLTEEMEEYQRQCIQVREKALASLKSRLPELFRAMSDFSLATSDMYRDLRSISHQNTRNES